MHRHNSKIQSIIYIISDALVILFAFAGAYLLRTNISDKPLAQAVSGSDFVTAFAVIMPLWIVVFASMGLYEVSVYGARLREWSRLLIGTAFGILLIIAYEYFTFKPFFPAKMIPVYAFGLSFLLLVLSREILRLLRGLLFQFNIGISRVLIVGNSPATHDIAQELADTRRSGYAVIAVAGPQRIVPKGIGAAHYTTIEQALSQIKEHRVDTIIQTDLYDSDERNQQILGAAQVHHIHYSFIPGEPEFYAGKNTVNVFLGYPMIHVSQTPLVGWGEILKRMFDVLFVLITAPLWLTILLIVSLCQKLLNPGPIFYKSTRLSRFSEPVTLYKFRSMGRQYGSRDAAEEFEAMGRPDLAREYRHNRKVANDPRITRFGKFLRDTSLDEFPQIINVLRGDLSLVGPRPILPQEVNFSRGKAALLHSVKSGMTGLWQVSGRSNLSFDERIELETFYAQNWSFWLDIKILFKTIAVVLRKSGAK